MITELNADEPYSYIILGGILHSSFVEWALSVPGKFQQVCNYTIILTDIAKVQDSTFDTRLLRAGLKKRAFLQSLHSWLRRKHSLKPKDV